MQETRHKIIECALEEFNVAGYRKAKISDIAERADIGYGTFYQYFNNKRDLLLFVGEEISQNVGDYSYLKTYKGLGLRERLYYGMIEILKYYKKNSAALAALHEAAASEMEFAASISRIHEKLFERTSRDINYFMKKGLCRDVVDENIIMALTYMIDGYAQKIADAPKIHEDISKIADSLTEVAYRVLFDDNVEA